MHMYTHTCAQAPFSGCPAPQALARTLWLTQLLLLASSSRQALAWAPCLHSAGWVDPAADSTWREAAIPGPETLLTGSCRGPSYMPTLPLISCAHSCVQGMGSSYHCVDSCRTDTRGFRRARGCLCVPGGAVVALGSPLLTATAAPSPGARNILVKGSCGGVGGCQ